MDLLIHQIDHHHQHGGKQCAKDRALQSIGKIVGRILFHGANREIDDTHRGAVHHGGDLIRQHVHNGVCQHFGFRGVRTCHADAENLRTVDGSGLDHLHQLFIGIAHAGALDDLIQGHSGPQNNAVCLDQALRCQQLAVADAHLGAGDGEVAAVYVHIGAGLIKRGNKRLGGAIEDAAENHGHENNHHRIAGQNLGNMEQINFNFFCLLVFHSTLFPLVSDLSCIRRILQGQHPPKRYCPKNSFLIVHPAQYFVKYNFPLF